MTLVLMKRYLLVLCATLVWGAGCSKEAGPPPPLAAERIAPELENLFSQAKPEAKDLVTKVTTGLQTKDYATSYDAVQALMALPDLSKDQRALCVRATLTVYGLLQDAQDRGDDKAAAAIRYHQSTK
jgi:hypothetical protein